MNPVPLSSRNFSNAFVLLLVVAISLLFLAVAWPFLKPLLLAMMLGGLCHPLYRWIARHFRGRKSLASITTLAILVLIVIGPIGGFLTVVVSQALEISEKAVPWLRQLFAAGGGFNAHDWLVKRFPLLEPYAPTQDTIVENIGSAAKAAGAYLVASVSRVTASTATFVLNVFVMLYAMFFFLRDGEMIVDKVFSYLPLGRADEMRIRDRFTSVTRATIKGSLLIGIVQGSLAGGAFWVAGIDGAAFWGVIMMIVSVVPSVGTALVWVPAVIYLYVTGHTWPATLLTIWCVVVVSTIDNVLRPILVGRDARMPDLLVFIGTVGGLFLFGPIGFIAGPIVCGLLITCWDIYGTTFREILPPVKGRVNQQDSIMPAPDLSWFPPPTPAKPTNEDSDCSRR